jgi:HK97 gp10 family phage protein
MADGIRTTWHIRENRFPSIIQGMETKAEAIVAKTAMDLEAHAKSLAPVDTGTLKNSIQASRIGDARWRVVVGAEYGMYVEWGTVHNAAQPFLQPAINAVTPAFLSAIRTVLH